MPQMAPMPWIMILISTLLMLFFFSSMIYFSEKPLFSKIYSSKTNYYTIKW